MILYIGNKLSKHGINPTAIETLGPRLAESYSIVTVSDKKNQILRLFDIIVSLFKFRVKTKVVLVDTYSGLAFYFVLITALICRALSIPYVLVLHGGNLESRLKHNPKISALIFNHAFRLVTPSFFLYDIFKSYGFNKVTYIPNSIDISGYAYKFRNTVRCRLLWVRSFQDIYKPKMAIDVLTLLNKKFPDSELCMVGPDKDGSLEECRIHAKAAGVDSNVVFTGKLQREEWTRLSTAYDIFINTTSVDNTPFSVIEAMALGLPVVSTNVGGIPYLVRNEMDGILVDHGDSAAMAEQITRLIQSPDLVERITLNARKKVEDFDWENVKKTWFQLLNDVI